MKLRSWIRMTWPVAPIVAALLVTSLILIIFNTSPKDALAAMIEGSFGDTSKVLQVLAFLVPLSLAASGLLVTFTAGLWNIGVEGQIFMGGIFSVWVGYTFIGLPPFIHIPFAFLAAVLLTRSVIFYGLNTFLPLFWIHVLGQSKAAAGTALTVLMASIWQRW